MGSLISRVSARAASPKRPNLPPEKSLAKPENTGLVHQAEKDPALDALLTQLHGSISGHSIKVLDEETERSLAEAKHARKDLREARLVGRITTEEFRLLMQKPELAQAGDLPREIVEEIARKNGISEAPFWNVLSMTRIPPIVKHPDGYLIGKSWTVSR